MAFAVLAATLVTSRFGRVRTWVTGYSETLRAVFPMRGNVMDPDALEILAGVRHAASAAACEKLEQSSGQLIFRHVGACNVHGAFAGAGAVDGVFR